MKAQDLLFLLPEITISSMAILILLMGAFIEKKSHNILYYFSQIALWLAVMMCLYIYKLGKFSLPANLFVVDSLSLGLKIISCITLSLVFFYSKHYLVKQKLPHGEYFSLSLFSLLGLSVLVSSKSFLTLYLGVELLTMPLYTLVAINQKRLDSSEAAIKYLVLGAMASGMLLYGISLLYGVSGTIELPVFAEKVASFQVMPDTLWFGILLVIAGVAFKLGAVPFHMWIPDVYQASSLTITLFIGTIPKFAAFGMACRVFLEAFVPFTFDWKPLITILAIASLVVGNFAALFQTNIKRMLGYSAMSHVGFILLGFITGTTSGVDESLFYLLIYGLMILGVFGCLLALSNNKEVENIQDLKGLSHRNPLIAGLLLVLLLSLAGIPPTAGFSAKFFILQDLLNHGKIGLTVLTLLLTVLGAYYYLKVIKVMYFEEKSYELQMTKINFIDHMVLSCNGLSLIWLGIFPMPLFNLCMTLLQHSYSAQ